MTGARADAAITEFLGRPVTVTRAPDDGPAYVDEADLHLLTVAALGAWDVRRFRPNLLLDTRVDLDDALGYRVRLGSVTLEVTKRTKRCAMTTCAQPGLPKDVGVLRSLAHERDLRQGVYARVVTPGRITLGDDMHLL
jgi:uncharacterized protein YcbX